MLGKGLAELSAWIMKAAERTRRWPEGSVVGRERAGKHGQGDGRAEA
jgi:hypothetical protein